MQGFEFASEDILPEIFTILEPLLETMFIHHCYCMVGPGFRKGGGEGEGSRKIIA